jgi:phosphoribosylanthranilate isomerase
LRVKVCCIQDVEEARLAIRLGADAVGLVAGMPSGPGPIPEARIVEIAATVPPTIATFLLTSLTDAAAIADQVRRCCVNTVQICDRLSSGTHEDLRRALPGVKIVQVIHVTGPEALAEAMEARSDALLLDSGTPQAEVKVLGGTGRTHDWAVSRRIVEESGKPVFLAGGLHAGNVAEAIRAVGPFGVDVCTRVRDDRFRLDAESLSAFIDAARSRTG